MALFIGYDPGGHGKHGVAAAEIAESGEILAEPTLRSLADAAEVCDWLERFDTAVALGIDTLLAWSRTGSRACDNALRAKYRAHGGSVIAQNSLYSSMTVNGAMVAQHGQARGLTLVESHPKLLLAAALHSDAQGFNLAERHHRMLASAQNDEMSGEADHMGDALVAAWCASRWYFGKWSFDLYSLGADELVFPACAAVYPWPETVPAVR